MKALIVMLALLFGVALTGEASAAPTVCRSAKPAKAKGFWSWRMIDGRKCWYQGKAGRAKTSLHWQQQRTRVARKIPGRETPRPESPPDEPLLASVWPEALPPATSTFTDRWPDQLPPAIKLPPPDFPTMAFAFASPAEAAPLLSIPPRATPPSNVKVAILLVLGPAGALAIVWGVEEWAAARRRRRALPYYQTRSLPYYREPA
jgi:hypothetical protein